MDATDDPDLVAADLDVEEALKPLNLSPAGHAGCGATKSSHQASPDSASVVKEERGNGGAALTTYFFAVVLRTNAQFVTRRRYFRKHRIKERRKLRDTLNSIFPTAWE